MARKPRVEYEGAIYHVVQRGNNKEYIFQQDTDKRHWFNQIMELKEETGFCLYAYALMDNHYHLVMQTPNKSLASIMHRLNMGYSKYFNWKHQHSGHVFQGAYKSVNVKDETQMLAVMRYVHFNPVKAGICAQPEDYPWSSDVAYRTNQHGLIDTDLVFDIFSTDRWEALRKYCDFVAQPNEMEDYLAAYSTPDEPVITDLNIAPQYPPGLDLILGQIARDPETFYLIKNGSRRRDLTACKIKFIKTATDLQCYTLKEIATSIGISESAVANLMLRSNK